MEYKNKYMLRQRDIKLLDIQDDEVNKDITIEVDADRECIIVYK